MERREMKNEEKEKIRNLVLWSGIFMFLPFKDRWIVDWPSIVWPLNVIRKVCHVLQQREGECKGKPTSVLSPTNIACFFLLL